MNTMLDEIKNMAILAFLIAAFTFGGSIYNELDRQDAEAKQE